MFTWARPTIKRLSRCFLVYAAAMAAFAGARHCSNVRTAGDAGAVDAFIDSLMPESGEPPNCAAAAYPPTSAPR
jgi:hypothetical protein